MMSEQELQYQVVEDRAELARHHKNFAQIAAMIDKALEAYSGDPASYGAEYESVLRNIRNIVG